MIYQLAVFYFAVFIAHAIFLAGSALVAMQFRVPIVAVKLGLGPKLFTRGKFTFCPLPLSAFVRLLDSREAGVTVDSEHAYDRQSRLVRMSIALSGPLALLLAAVALRGSAGWESFLHGFEQILSGAIAPASRGVELAGGYMHVAGKMGFVTALGVLVAKMAAVNLLPIPNLGGGAALLELMLPDMLPPTHKKIWTRFQQFGFFAMLALMLSWLYAVVLAVMAR